MCLNDVYRSNTTHGIPPGVTPFLRVFEASHRYVELKDVPGASDINFFLEPWHNNIFEFLSFNRRNGLDANEEKKLVYSLCIPDLL